MAKTILFLAANPVNTDRLRLDEEVREIDEGLRRARQREQFQLQQRWALRPDDLRRAMLDFEPEIVHFSGHGAGEDGIVLEDDLGQPTFVTGDALLGFFSLFPKVECVVLNACYSEIQADAIAKTVRYVVGVRQRIGDAVARKFSISFYDALGAGKSVEFAYKLGYNALVEMSGIPDDLAPVFVNKLPKGKLIDSSKKSDTQSKIPVPISPLPKIGKEPHIFISYSHQDKRFVDKLTARLQASGVPLWIDRLEIKAGDSIQERLEQAITNASYVLVILSPSSVNSKWVLYEFRPAMTRQLEEQRRLVIPILYKECKIPLFLAEQRYIDFRNPRKFDISCQDLLTAIDVDYFKSSNVTDQPISDSPIAFSEFLEHLGNIDNANVNSEEHDKEMDAFRDMPLWRIFARAIELNSFSGQIRRQALIGLAMMSHEKTSQGIYVGGLLCLTLFSGDIGRREHAAPELHKFITEIVESQNIELGYREMAFTHLMVSLNKVESRRLRFDLLPNIFPPVGYDLLADSIIEDFFSLDFDVEKRLAVLWESCDSNLYRDEIIHYLCRAVKWKKTPQLPEYLSSFVDSYKLWQTFHPNWQGLSKREPNIASHSLNQLDINDTNFTLKLLLDTVETSSRINTLLSSVDYSTMRTLLSDKNIAYYRNRFGNSRTFQFLCSIVASSFIDAVISMHVIIAIITTFDIEALEYDQRFPNCLLMKRQFSLDANVKYEQVSLIDILVDVSDLDDNLFTLLVRLLDIFRFAPLHAATASRLDLKNKTSKKMKKLAEFLEGKATANEALNLIKK